MADEGFFVNQRVELVRGDVFEMSPQKSRHATAVSLCAEAVRRVFSRAALAGEVHLRIQGPLVVDRNTELEPDVTAIYGGIRDYRDEHPRSAALVVEVADSSLDYDLGLKAQLYARAGLADYGVVDLRAGRVVVHREPTDDGYTSVSEHPDGETLTPLAAPDGVIAVGELLP